MEKKISLDIKWLTRIGSMLVLFGFFFPSMMVSCSALPDINDSYSLLDLANLLNQSILYLLPLGMVTVIILTVIPVTTSSMETAFFWSKFGCVVISVLSILLAYLSLSNQLNRYGGFDFKPQIGLLFLLGGYGLLIYSLAGEWQDVNGNGAASFSLPIRNVQAEASPPTLPPYSYAPRVVLEEQKTIDAHLKVVQGSMPDRMIVIHDRFTIGSTSGNSLQIRETDVLPTHAILRMSQGMWFIQDQNSASGTFVNGQRVQAARLNGGDQIRIGSNIFQIKI